MTYSRLYNGDYFGRYFGPTAETEVASLPLFDKVHGDVFLHNHAMEDHAGQHRIWGTDPIRLDRLATPTDNINLNATRTAHGLCPKGNNDATYFLNGQVAWAMPDHGSLGGLSDYADHAGYLMLDGTRELTAAWDAGSFQIRALTFQSDQATGTAPFTVASTTVVTSLNADTVDGSHAAAFLALAGGTMTGALVLATGTTSLLPLKFVSGPLLTAPVVGGMSFLTDDLYFTITTGTARQKVVLTTGLTATRVPYATTNGRLTDAAGFTFDGTILTASSYVSSVAGGTVPYACTSTTLCTNLNADQVDSAHVGTSGATIPLLNGTNTWSAVQTFGDKIAFTQVDGDEYIDSLGDGYVDIGATTAIRLKNVAIAENAIWLTQTDGNEYIDSLNDGYMDYAATTGHRFAGPRVTVQGDLYVGNNAAVDPAIVFDGDTSDGQITWMEDESYFLLSHVLQLPYLGAAPGTLTNGMVWMEADGLHIYYNDAEAVVAGV